MPRRDYCVCYSIITNIELKQIKSRNNLIKNPLREHSNSNTMISPIVLTND
jgi:hypothetical protein